jgi:Protein of unknown function (DUF1460)
MRKLIVFGVLGSALGGAGALYLGPIAQNQVVPPVQARSVRASSGPLLSPADRQEFNFILKQVQTGKIPRQGFGPMVQAIAQEFRGYAYEPDSLDRSEPEVLNLSLKRFDCVLFVEAMLGLTRTMSQDGPTEANFVGQMQAQRYRDGKVDGYCSRLHYFSDWILENQRQGRVRDLGDELGGIPLNRSLNYMSQHAQKYPRMAASASNRACIQSMEENLGEVNLRYVPTDRIDQITAQLEPGDIVAVVTNIPGLDVTHTGLVYRSGNGAVGLIHAAPSVGVIVSPDLQRYVGRLGNQVIGILVARPLSP